MATATKAGAKEPRAPKGATVTPDDFLRIERHLTTEVLVEREKEMRMLIRVALAGVNLHQIGAPGVAKSLMLRQFASLIVGARYFEKPLNANLPADALMGSIDIPRLVTKGEYGRNVEHFIPNAHVVFVDEIVRANGPVLDALLPVMNTEERQAEANGGMVVAPIKFMVTASNTWFDADNAQHGAISDRVTVMQLIEDVRSDDSFKEILRRHHARRKGERAGTLKRETITLEQLEQAQLEVNLVEFSPEFLDDAAKLRREAKGEGLPVSARRWVELVRVCRANAWMSGRDTLIPEDLVVVEHGMWRDRDEIPLAHKLVLPFHGRFEREAQEKRAEADKAFAALEAIRPQVEGTPDGEQLEQDVMLEAMKAAREIDAVKDRVEKVLVEAEKEKRDAANLHALDNELLAAQLWLHDHSLPTKYRP